MNRLIVLATIASFLLIGCYSGRDLREAKGEGYASGHADGKKIGFKEGKESVDEVAKMIAAQIKMKHEVIDSQRELILEKALACSRLPLNICPDSWMVDIGGYQKEGYSGKAGFQSFWIMLTGWLVPVLLLITFALGLAAVYRFLRLSDIEQQNIIVRAWSKELISKSSKLQYQLANFSQEEQKILDQVRMNIATEKGKLKEIKTLREKEDKSLNDFTSKNILERHKRMRDIDALNTQISALEAQKKLFGG